MGYSLWGRKRPDTTEACVHTLTNELTYKRKTDSQAERTKLRLLGGRMGRWDEQVHTAVFKMDNQQGPTMGFPGGSEDKASACNAGDPGSIPGSGRSPEGGNDKPLQYSCLENPMDRGAWWATVHRVARSWT